MPEYFLIWWHAITGLWFWIGSPIVLSILLYRAFIGADVLVRGLIHHRRQRRREP